MTISVVFMLRRMNSFRFFSLSLFIVYDLPFYFSFLDITAMNYAYPNPIADNSLSLLLQHGLSACLYWAYT